MKIGKFPYRTYILVFLTVFLCVSCLVGWIMVRSVQVKKAQLQAELLRLKIKLAKIDNDRESESYQAVVQKWQYFSEHGSLPILGREYEIVSIPSSDITLSFKDEKHPVIEGTPVSYARTLSWVGYGVQEMVQTFDLEIGWKTLNLVDTQGLLNMEGRKIVFRQNLDEKNHRWCIVCVRPNTGEY